MTLSFCCFKILTDFLPDTRDIQNCLQTWLPGLPWPLTSQHVVSAVSSRCFDCVYSCPCSNMQRQASVSSIYKQEMENHIGGDWVKMAFISLWSSHSLPPKLLCPDSPGQCACISDVSHCLVAFCHYHETVGSQRKRVMLFLLSIF